MFKHCSFVLVLNLGGLIEKDSGFRGLWRRVKPADKPDEVRLSNNCFTFVLIVIKGMPFDNDDAMFNPPAPSRLSQYEIPLVSYQEPSPLPADLVPSTPSNVGATACPFSPIDPYSSNVSRILIANENHQREIALYPQKKISAAYSKNAKLVKETRRFFLRLSCCRNPRI